MLILLPATCLSSVSLGLSLGLSNESLVEECWDAAKQKLVLKSEKYGCVIELDEMQVDEIDNRWYSPSKYIWFSSPAWCGNVSKNVSVMLQFYRGVCR